MAANGFIGRPASAQSQTKVTPGSQHQEPAHDGCGINRTEKKGQPADARQMEMLQ